LTNRERWQPFHTKHPQRSAASWGEAYRRYDKEISSALKEDRARVKHADRHLVSPRLQTSSGDPYADNRADRVTHPRAHQYLNTSTQDENDQLIPSTTPASMALVDSDHSTPVLHASPPPTTAFPRDLPHAPPPHLKRKFYEERLEAHEGDKRHRAEDSST